MRQICIPICIRIWRMQILAGTVTSLVLKLVSVSLQWTWPARQNKIVQNKQLVEGEGEVVIACQWWNECRLQTGRQVGRHDSETYRCLSAVQTESTSSRYQTVRSQCALHRNRGGRARRTEPRRISHCTLAYSSQKCRGSLARTKLYTKTVIPIYFNHTWLTTHTTKGRYKKKKKQYKRTH